MSARAHAEWRASGRIPTSRPPPRKEGQALRVLERQVGETIEGAIVRAERLGWWMRKTRRAPWVTTRHWVWIVREER
jgi:hypothetical protein